MQMTNNLIFIVLVGQLIILIVSCKTPQKQAGSNTKAFFENTLRREATKIEQEGIVRVSAHLSCAGFFIANSENLLLIMTANHCMNFDPKSWCDSRMRITDPSTGSEYRCKRIVIHSPSHDPVIMEVTGNREKTAKSLVLAGFTPEKNTRLKILGFPSDTFSSGGLMVSENCWLTEPTLENPWKGKPQWDLGTRDKTFGHNCSVYYGNSGGPILIEGTNIVAGQPYGVRTTQNYDFAIYPGVAAAISDLVTTEKSNLELKSNGIITIQDKPITSTPGNYVSSGVYRNNELNCEISIMPIYNTGSKLEKLKAWSNCNGGTGDNYELYQCSDDHCDYHHPEGFYRFISHFRSHSFFYKEHNKAKRYSFKLVNSAVIVPAGYIPNKTFPEPSEKKRNSPNSGTNSADPGSF